MNLVTSPYAPLILVVAGVIFMNRLVSGETPCLAKKGLI